jgi:hypothetical protein
LIQAQDPPGRFLTVRRNAAYEVASQEKVQNKIRAALNMATQKGYAVPDGIASGDGRYDTPYEPRYDSNKKRSPLKDPPGGLAPSKRHKSASKSVVAFERQKAVNSVVKKPGPTDVLCIKGKTEALGDIYFRDLVRKYRDKYFHTADATVRAKIRAKIERLIHCQDPPGLFLEVDEAAMTQTTTYRVASGERIAKKLDQALRRRNTLQDSCKKMPEVAVEQQKASDTVVTKPGPTDVLCIKGKPKTSLFPGGIYLNDLLQKYRSKYFYTADATVRAKIRAKIVILIHRQDPPGRFLEVDDTTTPTTYRVASAERISRKLDLALGRSDRSLQPQRRVGDQRKTSRIPRPPIHATPAHQRHSITVNSRVSILWVSLNAYFPGTVEGIRRQDPKDSNDNDGFYYYTIRYDDDSTEIVDLTRRKFKILQLARAEEAEESEDGDDGDRKPAAK